MSTKQEIKDKVKTESIPVKRVFEKTINQKIAENEFDLQEAAINAPKFNNCKKTLYQNRNTNKIIPKSTADINFAGDFEIYKKTTNGKRVR